MRALIFANGVPPSRQLALELAARADLLVAADGGARAALDCGLQVDAVVGDLDSVTAADRNAVPPERVHHVPNIDLTDLQKAINFAIERGATEIDVVGAGGGRADHALANLSVLLLYREKAAVRIIDDQFEVSAVAATAIIEAAAGTLVSLIAIGPCEGVTTTGMRWNLSDHDLRFSPYGVHNEVAEGVATVSVRRGDLLLFRGRWVEKHT